MIRCGILCKKLGLCLDLVVTDGSTLECRKYRDVEKLYESLDVIGDSSSGEASGRAAKWLSHCLSHDSGCKVPNPNYMPRRLLNVGLSDECDPFLFEAKDPAPYACLSYCWGSNTEDIPNTTTKNLQSHYCHRQSVTQWSSAVN